MLSFHLQSVNDAEKLSNFCKQFREEIDVIHGRQIIDGKSVLGVISLVGSVVSVEILSEDNNIKNNFHDCFEKVFTKGGDGKTR